MTLEDKLVRNYLEKKRTYLGKWAEDLNSLWENTDNLDLLTEVEEDMMIIDDLLNEIYEVINYLAGEFETNLPHAKVEVLLRKYKK